MKCQKETNEYKVDIVSEANLLLAVYHRAAAFGLYYSLFTLEAIKQSAKISLNAGNAQT